MVFLRPVIMRDADAAKRMSMDRYELIRALQTAAQPPSNALLPLSDSPVLAPERKVEQGDPLAVPANAPGAVRPGPVEVPPSSAPGGASAPRN
jgi:general secretion pathway protein D